MDVKRGKTESPNFPLPKLEAGKQPVNSRAGFEEGETFPPPDWQLSVLSGNICRPDEAAALTDSRGLLCQDLQSSQGSLIRAGLRFPLPIDRLPSLPMSWRLTADIQPAELQMSKGQVIHPLAFLAGDDLVAAPCLRKIGDDEYIAGVLIRSAHGLFRERIDVNEGEIFTDGSVRWELELLRLGTRQNDCRRATEWQRGGPHQRRHPGRRARYQLRGDFASAQRLTDNAARRSITPDGSAAIDEAVG